MNFILKVPKKTLKIASLSTLELPIHSILQNPLISGSKGGSLQKTTYNHFESLCILPLKPYLLNKVRQSTMQIFIYVKQLLGGRFFQSVKK